jgi:hypothetical protein
MRHATGSTKGWLVSNLLTAALTLPVVPLAWFLGISSRGQVIVGGEPVGDLCLFRSLTGFRCPYCGLTRSFIASMHLDLVEAFRFHPAGTLTLVFFALTGLWALVRAFRRQPPLLSSPTYSKCLRWVVIISLATGLTRGLWDG